MPIVYQARWTRGQILDQALHKAGNSKIRQLAREQLNRLLERLYTEWEWPFLYATAAITIPAVGVFNLPADFLKTADEESLRSNASSVAGRVTPIMEVDILTLNRMNDGVSTATTPRVWAADYSARAGIAWPVPVEPLGCSLFYKFLPPDMATDDAEDYDADIPIFPSGATVATALEVWVLEYEQDHMRAGQRKRDLEADLSLLRNAAMPPKSQPTEVPLDPMVFGRRPFRAGDTD